MAKNYYYIDDATAQGPNTLLAIANESARFGIGATTSIDSISGIIILDDGTPLGTAGTVNFGANLSVSPVSAGIVTVTGSGGNVTVTQTGYSCDNPITVTGGSNIGIGSTSNAYGRKFIQTTTPTSPCDGDIWYDTTSGTTGDTAPAGSVIYHAASAAPTGYLKANGASLSTTTYATLFAAIGYTFGGSGASFNVPDLRGEFARGWDDGRGVDSGRAFGSTQTDDFKSHSHVQQTGQNDYFAGGGSPQWPNNWVDTGTTARGSTQNTGGTETRPRNIALLACIKF